MSCCKDRENLDAIHITLAHGAHRRRGCRQAGGNTGPIGERRAQVSLRHTAARAESLPPRALLREQRLPASEKALGGVRLQFVEEDAAVVSGGGRGNGSGRSDITGFGWRGRLATGK